jgi:hypothetical protein
MKWVAASFSSLLSLAAPCFAQMTYSDLPSYCRVMSEASSTTLLARTEGVPRAKAEELMREMTDPASIRMVKEVIEYAYSRPATMGIDAMRGELRTLCIARKIFVQ